MRRSIAAQMPLLPWRVLGGQALETLG